MSKKGTIFRVAGPFIIADGMVGSRMHEPATIGEAGVIGETVRLGGARAR
ncbi:MAG TPA: hypothetical protein VJ529_02660 [Candidatus Bathyarchaeia archaeon]|nr:hypothetical protein [Candidatus Bathyarchaeia archaeon]